MTPLLGGRTATMFRGRAAEASPSIRQTASNLLVPACTYNEGSRKYDPLIFYVNKRVSGCREIDPISGITSRESVKQELFIRKHFQPMN